LSNFKIFDLDILLSNFPKSTYFMDIINTPTMEVGIINLKKNQKDTQQPHKLDEIHYIISGIGKIIIDGSEQDVISGTIIYVPKNTPHFFQTNSIKLTVLYILA
jgi:mannose-6-phosphate isomerase-like protein (cupin superfamily)